MGRHDRAFGALGNRATLTTRAALTLAVFAAAAALGQPGDDRAAFEAETLEHFQALLRADTRNPPGNETAAVDVLGAVLEREGVSFQIFALEPERANLVVRLRGNGAKPPLLIMAHTDVVTVDPAKWSVDPFSGTAEGGYVISRGTVDDKDNLVASLMTVLDLARRMKRGELELARDLIFLAESGEEGTTHVGIAFMVEQHLDAIQAEFCLAEGGGVVREGGAPRYASVQTLEKRPYAVDLIARGVAGHGSVPLQTNSVVKLSKAVAAVADWRSPVRLNETTSAYFERLATISEPAAAARYLALLDPETAPAADEYLLEHEPRHASMIRTSLSPNIIDGGYRINVIPSEARATVDVRALPDEDVPALLEKLRGVIGDDAVEVGLGERAMRPLGGEVDLGSEAFLAIERGVREHYDVITLPSMSTGATDMAFLRAAGIQCYGIGPAIDVEDGPKGFGAHSDQERILVTELHRFVRFHRDLVEELVRAER
jgi:acetylornithine deacetylase/succinyl-diaminopimelate desuccinylase-like protein